MASASASHLMWRCASPCSALVATIFSSILRLPRRGDLHMDSTASFTLQPGVNQNGINRCVLEKEERRDVGGRVVELLDESGHNLGVALVLGAFHDEMVSADGLARPDKEYLDPCLVLAAGQGYVVLVLEVEGVDFLGLRDPVDGAYLVPEGCCTLELESLCGLVHAGTEVLDYGLVLPFEEEDDLVDDFAVLVLGRRPDARPDTTVDVEVEAGARVGAGDVLGAGTVRKSFLMRSRVRRTELADAKGPKYRAPRSSSRLLVK